MPERCGARAVRRISSCPLQIMLLCPKKPQVQPLFRAAISSSLRGMRQRLWETRLEGAPGASPWLSQQGELAALGIGVNREGKSEDPGQAL